MATVLPYPSTLPTPATGLSLAEAQRRLTEFGPNEIRREQATSPLRLIARQCESPVIWILLGASIISTLCPNRVLPGAPGRTRGRSAALDDCPSCPGVA
jgi:magnesium-transporting ATPase (P-type)